MASRPGGIIGWDIGGAHVKFAALAADGRLREVAQLPCPLWRGLGELEAVLLDLNRRYDLSAYRHALTMTGELVDLFPDRRRGVRALLRTFMKHAGRARVLVYTMSAGLRTVDLARRRLEAVASANWHATAAMVARRCPEAVLVDIGSTTTDIVPIRRGRVDARGCSDGDRLRHQELLYTGVVRTPVMAVVRQAPFGGEWQGVAAEWFANMGDVYRLTGQLPLRHHLSATADGRGLSAADCARRLARMLGRDAAEATAAQWRRLARHLATEQLQQVRAGLERVLSRRPSGDAVTIVGAGCGCFIARELARRLQCPYTELATLVSVPARWREMATVCAPALAVARLAAES
ncbi:MAG: H4MPT-linked C1 transfer pathway protein [Gammaproteobacteria bacterium]|nr:H4MPT-linked C1 transfer pathway protein [Gammaproteobacteria bacterium]